MALSERRATPSQGDWARRQPPAGGDGGNGGGGGMEARVAKLEADVGHIQTTAAEIKTDVREIRQKQEADFRILFGSLIAVALGLAALMAKGFHWI